MKAFYEFIVIDESEYNNDTPISDYEYDDYRYWGLYDMHNDKMIFFGDNMHNNGIEDEIEAFLKGLDYAKCEYSLETGAIIIEGNDYANITSAEALDYLRNGKMIDEVL